VSLWSLRRGNVIGEPEVTAAVVIPRAWVVRVANEVSAMLAGVLLRGLMICLWTYAEIYANMQRLSCGCCDGVVSVGGMI
jgi:hypothetical protein